MNSYLLAVIDRECHVFAELHRANMKIGRDPANDVVVQDEACSRFHAEIRYESREWTLIDLGSHNGTKVNGNQLNEDCVVLTAGDFIELANQEWTFSLEPTIPIQGSVTHLLSVLKGDNQAEKELAEIELFDRYFARLTGLAHRKLQNLSRRVEDEEDAALSAIGSFLGHMKANGFPELNDREGIWALLATMTARKVIRQIERQTAKKRSTDREQELHPNLPLHVFSDQELLVALDDTLDLMDDSHRLVALRMLTGFSKKEIAEETNVSIRTIERQQSRIRDIFKQHYLRTC